MHELAICQALVTELDSIARQHDGWVQRVVLAVGPLCGVEAAALEFAYPLACVQSRAEGSRLRIQWEPVHFSCRTCGARGDGAPLICRSCGAWDVALNSGDELVLREVEITSEKPSVMSNGIADV